MKGIQTGNKESKLSLFTNNLILYIGEPKDSIKRLLELITEFRRGAGYQINEHKLMIQYTNSTAEQELISTVPFKIAEKGPV